MDLSGALELCCSYGLRLLTLETKAEFDCLQNAKPRIISHTPYT
jgi:hypothetical protein